MRRHVAAAALVAQLSLVTVVTARAADPATAVLAVAAASLLAVLGLRRLEPPGRGAGTLGLLDPAWALALLVRRRLPGAALVPAWAASVVGGLVGGLLGGVVVDRLPRLLVQDQPDLVVAGVVLAVVGVASGWTASWADRVTDGRSAAEARAAAGSTVLPAVSGAAAVPALFVGAANPAVLFAVGVAGQADWTYVVVAVTSLTVAVVVTAVLGLVGDHPR